MQSEPDQIMEKSPKGRFIRFNEQIGKGTYKTVYRGYDEESGCEIAWNVIHLDQLPQQEERKRISEELSILNNIKHPNIISFINAWVSKNKSEVIFITEIVHGGSLKKHLRKIQRPRLKILKHWCREILKGLEYLHSIVPYPVIHRDIKCDNIFINTHNNQVRIGDFGLAIKLKQSDFTQSVLGTPEFMAPEIYEEKYGPSVDIYAFGMTCLEMATQKRPYEECTAPNQIYQKVMNRIKPKSLDLIQNQDLKDFILKCLEDQEKRPTATELLNDKFLQEQEDDHQHVVILEEEQSEQNLQSDALKYNPVFREQLDFNNSILVQLNDGDEMHIKITFVDQSAYNQEFQEFTKLIVQKYSDLQDNQQFVQFQEQIIKFGGVEKVLWVKPSEESKKIMKTQFLQSLESFQQTISPLLQDVDINEWELIEQQLLVQFQQQRKQIKSKQPI
ncbi:unnamed protein product (macronuclear) [Paramecium tetraurelia]|uniref:Protein kinase domain-containing protein n=1 Tax=Paramecium tetraurelia TaxID=5888 RepID=A0CW91_PARTE|nr:uncharacterized protein GSPATT00001260001 [Paramecium tetraurelia]CAK75058.1 unnamed protein product [Paramecium tetraurelia]|eukprot:XP_001442455.1 hypothetical protein (macronuclear) [Paramecium tetraurelia strain d4-2]